MKHSNFLVAILIVLVALLALCVRQCKKPCPDCTPPNPHYTIKPGNLIIDPQAPADVTGVTITASTAANDSLIFPTQTIPAGQILEIAVDPNIQDVHVEMEYQTGPDGTNYCPHEATLRVNEGIPILDVVIMFQGNAGQGTAQESQCASPKFGGMSTLTLSPDGTIPAFQSYHLPLYLRICGEQFTVTSVQGALHVYSCKDLTAASSNLNVTVNSDDDLVITNTTTNNVITVSATQTNNLGLTQITINSSTGSSSAPCSVEYAFEVDP
ncbi:MAG: hypothetical protein R2792_14950 [Saprospiraceae bacterium]